MENIEKTSSDILLEAANLLEEEDTWCHGFYRKTAKGCQMCAHTAISYCGTPEIKQIILENSCNIYTNISSIVERDYYVKSSSINLTPSQRAHRSALNVGLTYHFNDQASSKESVISKLREAARLEL